MAACVVNLVLGLWLIRQGRHTGSLIQEADGRHVLTASDTSLGVAVVLATGYRRLDGLVAIVVALNILRTGFDLVRSGVIGPMDRADPALLARIVESLQAGRQSGWSDVH